MFPNRHGARALDWRSAPWLAVGLLAACASLGANAADNARVIVKLRTSSPLVAAETRSPPTREAARAQALGQRIGHPLRTGAAITDRTQVLLASGISSEALAQRLNAEADVEYAEPDRRVHRVAVVNDPLYPDGAGGATPVAGQWYLRAPADAVQSSINIEPAWAIAMGSPSIVVAVLDTGVRFEHPDLKSVAAGGNLLPGYDMISDVATANDGDGRDADTADPGDWVSDSELKASGGPFFECEDSPSGSSWHGTMVSGLIAALTGNGIGMASVAPDVHVLPVRVLGKCGGFISDIVAGMRWAAGLSVPGLPLNASRARVLNLSLGAQGACPSSMRDAVSAINALGGVVVAAAGNSAGHALGLPANCAGVIAVAGLRHVGTKVGFSDLGPDVAISAPAGNCVNVDPGSACLYPVLTTSDSGTNAAAGSIYTDSFNTSVGTSFSSPLVAGTVALMLSANSALTPAQVRQTLQSTARPFPTTGGDNGDGTPVPQCTAPQYDTNGQPVDQLQCYCTTMTCGAGMLDAGAAVAAVAASAPPFSVQGLWWNAPAGSESGWGINVSQQGDVLFVTWFTYAADGSAWWLVMRGDRVAPNTYQGTLYGGTGPPYYATPFDPAQVAATPVGTATLAFANQAQATFGYTVKGVSQVKQLVRQQFGASLPTCAWSATANLNAATNYQDIWWVSPAGSESGWGINFTHQGDTIFATWFTYGANGKPTWFVFAASQVVPRTFAGDVYTASGPPYYVTPFDPAQVAKSKVGTATLTFQDGNHATLAYNVNGIGQSKPLTREIFGPAGGTVCQ
jgi:serine protease